VLAMDGLPVDSLPMFEADLYRTPHGKPVAFEIQRGSQDLTLTVPVVEEQEHDFDDLADLVKPEKSLVRGLGILGVEISSKISNMLPELRVNSGVIVAARAAGSAEEIGLQPGDIIHSLNGAPIVTLEGLRTALGRLKSGDPVALQIEREGTLMYVGFNVE
jgi:serine protease Do